MNILILGNGFDLAHGLPTSYGDFLNFVKVFEEFKKECSKEDSPANILATAKEEQKDYFQFFADLLKDKQAVFQELDSLLYENKWINYFQSKYEKNLQERKTSWIDFENEISEFIKTLDLARGIITNQVQNDGFKGLGNKAIEDKLAEIFDINECYGLDFILDNKKILLEDLNKLTRCLEIYLSGYVEQLKITKVLPDIEELQGINCVLNFNYTNTYSKVYDQENKVEYDYIHGRALIDHDINDCNLVLGIDEYLTGETKNTDNEFIYFKKFFQRIYKKTGCKYLDWVERINKTPKVADKKNNVYIFGHSLGITDKDILASLILARDVQTTVFYYNQDSLGREIVNLVKVIGEEKVISMTSGKDASLIFKQQQEARDLSN